jgi:hypothetical protein
VDVDKIVHSENNGLKGGNNNISTPAINLLFEPSHIHNLFSSYFLASFYSILTIFLRKSDKLFVMMDYVMI